MCTCFSRLDMKDGKREAWGEDKHVLTLLTNIAKFDSLIFC